MSTVRRQVGAAERHSDDQYKKVSVRSLIEAWRRYCVTFGVKPRGTEKQLAALWELIK